jgi:hypothetical protein
MRKAIVLLLTLVLMVAAMPLAVNASNKIPLTCSLTLAVVDPGTSVVNDNKVKTSGETTLGALDCDVDSLDGVFSSIHSSKIKLSPDGSFTGKLKGTFSLETAAGTLAGRMKAGISGVVIGFIPVGETLIPVHSVTDVGKWKLTNDDVQGKGTLTVNLVGVVGIPAAMGGLKTVSPGFLGGQLVAEDAD